MARRLTAILLVLALAAGCGSGSDDGGGGEAAGGDETSTTSAPVDAREVASTEGGAETGWLFVLEADGGTSDGATLSLTGVDDDLVAFGDRPARRAERLPTAGLIDDWSTLGFDDDPPNAAVTVSADGREQTAVVVLRDPTFDAGSGTLTFATEPVADDGGAPFGHGGQPIDALPASFGAATLFVDAGGASADPEPGQISVSGVPEEEFELQKEAAEKAGSNACITAGGLEICQILEWYDSSIAWTVAVALVDGDDFEESSFQMQVVHPGPVGGTVYAEAGSVEDTDSRWVTAVWEGPAIDVPSLGIELAAEVQIGDSLTVPMSCIVRQAADPLDYYCLEGAE